MMSGGSGALISFSYIVTLRLLKAHEILSPKTAKENTKLSSLCYCKVEFIDIIMETWQKQENPESGEKLFTTSNTGSMDFLVKINFLNQHQPNS